MEYSSVPDISKQTKKNSGSVGSLWIQIAATGVVTMLSFSVGTNIGFSGSSLPMLKADVDINITNQQATWIASLPPLMTIPGCLIGAALSDRIGRRLTLIIASLPFIIGWLCIGLAPNIYFIMIGRCLCGLANMGLSSVNVYVSESVEKRLIPSLSSASLMMSSAGMLLMYILGSALPWRIMALVACFPSLIVLIGTWLLPETPSWLNAHKKQKEAEVALRKLRGKKCDCSVEMEAMLGSRTKEALKGSCGGAWKSFGILLVLFFVQQTCGVYVIFNYAVGLFSTFQNVDQNVATILVGACRLFFTLVGVIILRFFRIRPILITSCCGMAIGMTVMAIYSYIQPENLDWLPAIVVLAVVAFNTPGVTMVPWVLLGQLIPFRVRGAISNVTVCFAGLFNFASLMSFPVIMNAFGSTGAYGMFAVISILGTVFAVFAVPETRGKSMAEIEDKIGGHKAVTSAEDE